MKRQTEHEAAKLMLAAAKDLDRASTRMMEQDAYITLLETNEGQFAEWCSKTGWNYVSELTHWVCPNKVASQVTADLFQIFLSERLKANRDNGTNDN